MLEEFQRYLGKTLLFSRYPARVSGDDVTLWGPPPARRRCAYGVYQDDRAHVGCLRPPSRTGAKPSEERPRPPDPRTDHAPGSVRPPSDVARPPRVGRTALGGSPVHGAAATGAGDASATRSPSRGHAQSLGGVRTTVVVGAADPDPCRPPAA